MPKGQVVSLAAVRFDRAYRSLLSDLEEFCLSLDEDDMERAQAQFLGAAPIEDENEDDEHAAFLDWLAFSYETWQTGETVITQFTQQRQDHLEKDLLATWQSARQGLYEVMEVAGPMTTLRDYFTAHELQAELPGDPMPRPGALLMGRLLPVGEIYRPGYDLQDGTQEIIPLLMPVLETELARMRRAFPAATWTDLFRERWPLIRDLIPVMTVSLEQHVHIPVPSILPGQSQGQTAPPDGAPPEWERVAHEVRGYMDRHGVPFTDCNNALRLWWDAAAIIQPRIGKPAVWAAGVVYAWHRWIQLDEFSQSTIAPDFSVSATGVGAKAKEITAALSLIEQDDRYVDPLDPLFRANILGQYLQPEVVEILADPIYLFGREHPDLLQKAQSLNMEAQEMLQMEQVLPARKKCMEALNLCPVFAPARNNLAISYFISGDYRTAIKTAEPVLETHPEYVFTLALLAQAHHRIKHTKEARSYLAEALLIYRRWLKERPESLERDHQGDRQHLWSALAVMQEDQLLYDLTLMDDITTLNAHGLTLSAIAADRSGDRERAKEWLTLASKAAPASILLGALILALEKMDAGAVPAFPLDYELTVDSMEPGTKKLAPAARAVLIALAWSQDPQEAEDAIMEAASYKDPWVAQFLGAVILRPELPDALKAKAVDALAQLIAQ